MGDYLPFLPQTHATGARNATARAARACPSPLKNKKSSKNAPKKAAFYQVVFSSFFVITIFGTIGGVDTQRVTRPNYEFFGTFRDRITSFSELFTSFSELFGVFYDYLTTRLLYFTRNLLPLHSKSIKEQYETRTTADSRAPRKNQSRPARGKPSLGSRTERQTCKRTERRSCHQAL